VDLGGGVLLAQAAAVTNRSALAIERSRLVICP
jgi:hypothetical protein